MSNGVSTELHRIVLASGRGSVQYASGLQPTPEARPVIHRNRMAMLAAAGMIGMAAPRIGVVDDGEDVIPERGENVTNAAAPPAPERALSRQQRRAAERHALKSK
jgi:hypothetical protein